MARILLITHEFPPFRGGVATYCQELARAGIELGHHVTVFAPNYGRDLSTPDREKYPFRVIRFDGGMYKSRGLAPLVWNTVSLLRALDYDLLHAADWPFVFVLALINKFTANRFIATIHGTDFLGITRSKAARLLRLVGMYDSADRVLANSKFTRAQFLAEFPGSDERKVEVALLGVNRDCFAPLPAAEGDRVRERYSIAATNLVVLTVARMDERKGHRLVLNALQVLPRALKGRITYMMVGESLKSEYLGELQFMATQCGVQVVFTGKVSDDELRVIYSITSVFCMPGEPHSNRVEGFGLAYLEAAAQGVPSIANALWAIPEVVRHEQTGLLCDPQDPNALQAALHLVLTRGEVREQMGHAARDWAKGFTWEKCALKTYGPA